MRHMCNQPRFWKRPTTFLIITATMATAVILMRPGGLEAANPTLEAIQSQISGLPPAWDKTLPANDPGGPCPSNSSRFKCVMVGAAVRDNETGLVWEQSPGTTPLTWGDAQFQCNNKKVGNRKGWRLPTIQELASLIDQTALVSPTLPAGHPFSNVTSGAYWSATSDAGNTGNAWDVRFHNGNVFPDDKALDLFVWCVRGGQGIDPQ